jgi:hypothetical protein
MFTVARKEEQGSLTGAFSHLDVWSVCFGDDIATLMFMCVGCSRVRVGVLSRRIPLQGKKGSTLLDAEVEAVLQSLVDQV